MNAGQMLVLAAGQAETQLGLSTPPWVLWAIALTGVGFLVYSIVRHRRRMAGARAEDPALSEPQRMWAARQSGAPATPPAAGANSGNGEREEALRALIAAADARIAELRRLTGVVSDGGVARSAVHMQENPENRASRVFSMAAHGTHPAEIARVTGASESEVRLLLALRGDERGN